MSTDQPNIFFSVRKMEHPLNSYHDLAFIIKLHMTSEDSCPLKFLVFFNSRAEAQAGAEYLCEQLPPQLHDNIKWFHSGMTDEFHEDEMHALLVGDVFGHAATDAAGMVSGIDLIFLLRKLNILLQGIDLPDLTLVVQYRVPKELSTFIQRAGRAAHNPNLQATAVLLAEPSYFDDEKEKAAQRAAERNAKKRVADGHLQPSVVKQPCLSLDGSRGRGEVVEVVVPEIATESRCEPAMDKFLNADRRPEKCRRKVINNHFGNKDLHE